MAGQDTIMKALTRALSDGALEVLGVHGVELQEPLPTELPANTLRIDRAWRMRNGRIFHMEFQSTREPTLHLFFEYDVRLARAYKAGVQTVVMYHGGITSAPEELDIGVAVYRVENVYLSKLDGDEALATVERHLQADMWEPADRLRLGLAMNMHVRDEVQAFECVLGLIPAVPDETERDLVVSAILALGDLTLDGAQRTRLRRELRKVSKIAEELYQEGAENKAREVALKLLAEGVNLEVIVKATGLSRAEIEELRKQLL